MINMSQDEYREAIMALNAAEPPVRYETDDCLTHVIEALHKHGELTLQDLAHKCGVSMPAIKGALYRESRSEKRIVSETVIDVRVYSLRGAKK